MAQQGKQHCQIKECVCILSNKCVCVQEWKIFTMQHNGSRSVCEVPSAVWFLLLFFWSGTFEASQPFIPLQRGWIFWQNTWESVRGLHCFRKQALLLFGEKGAAIQSRRATLTQNDKLFAFIFSNSPHKTNDFSHSVPYGKTASQNISQVTNTIPSWTSSMRGGRVEPCDSFPELISTNKRAPGEGNRQLTSGQSAVVLFSWAFGEGEWLQSNVFTEALQSLRLQSFKG